jgi:hypothetical protein
MNASASPDGSFPPDVVTAVLRHMNDDHRDDSLVIVRAFGLPEATSAKMTGFDRDRAWFQATVAGEPIELRVPWGTPVTERAQLRPAVVVLYTSACEALGIPARQPGEH